MTRWQALLVATAIIGVDACRTRPRYPGPYGDKVAQDVPMIEKALGRPYKTPPHLEMRSRDQVREFLVKGVEEPRAQQQLAGEDFTYKVLGLIPDSLDLRKFMVSLLTEQIIGYYDPATKILYVVEGAQDTYIGVTIMHELVHALQDQYVNLDSIEHAYGDDDRESATQAVVEGQAVYEQAVLMAGGPNNIAIALPGGWDQMRQTIRDQEATQPIFASAPMVIQESLLFPYINGAEFIRRYSDRRPGSSPLDHLPQSTTEVMHDSAYFGAAVNTPIVVTLPTVAGAVYENDMGEFGTRLFFFQHLGNQSAAASAATGWKGDRYIAFRTSSGPGIAWVTVWDSPVSAATYVSSMGEVIKSRYSIEKPTIGADGTRRFANQSRTIVVSSREIGGRTTVLYVDVPAGASPDVLDLSRVTLRELPPPR